METLGSIIIFILIFGGVLTGFNFLMGYRKNHIRIDFDERYTNHKEYVLAITRELENQGRDVFYKGNRVFLIDGSRYIFIERNFPIGGVPMQRTILKPDKTKEEKKV